jgi:hypothetical protein
VIDFAVVQAVYKFFNIKLRCFPISVLVSLFIALEQLFQEPVGLISSFLNVKEDSND